MKLNFTKASLAKLQPPAAGRVVVRDTHTRGLVMQITANDARTYYLYKRVQGRPTRLLIGKYDELTIEQARTNAAKFAGQIAEGRNPQIERQQKRADEQNELTLGGLF